METHQYQCVRSLRPQVLGILGKAVGGKLNAWENHETRNAHQNVLAWKLFLFEFLNNFNVPRAGLCTVAISAAEISVRRRILFSDNLRH